MKKVEESANSTVNLSEIGILLNGAKKIAKKYRQLTGRPLGITGEVAEYEAARLLNLQLSNVRQPGYDATRQDGTRIQIKGRVLFQTSKPGQKVGRIRLDHDWDTVLLVLLDEEFTPLEIYEAGKDIVTTELSKPGSISRNDRGALSISKFKSISNLIWSRK